MTSDVMRAPRDTDQIRHKVFWRETEEVVPGPPLEGDVRGDVCVVGAGYTGMWTAYFLKQADPSLSIHVVEADYAGSGASGHGDGFITPTIGHNLRAFVDAFGTDRAQLAYSLVGRSILELRRFCQKNDIDAQLEPNGYFQVATSASQLRWLERDVELVRGIGARSVPRILTRDEIQRRISSPSLVGGMELSGALVNPHRLSRGLSRVLRASGVNLHEQSKVTEITRTAGGHRVRTAHGNVTAERLLLATNAHQHQFDQFRDAVKPMWNYAAITEPLTDEQLAMVDWPGREGFVEALNLIVFGRLTTENRLLIGGGPAPYFYGRNMDDRHMRYLPAAKALRATLAKYFPVWRDLRFTHVYGGCLDMTRDFVPHVGTDGNGVYFAHGYCGNGVALTHTVGRALRDLILDRDSSYRQLPFVNAAQPKYSSEPLSWLRIRAQNLSFSLQDRYPDTFGRLFGQ